MGTYGLKGVTRAWELEKLTTEQAIGQILQLIAEIEGRLREVERKYSRINRKLPHLAARVAREEWLENGTKDEEEDA